VALIAIQRSCIASPPRSCSGGSWPISASIGKPNVHWNGSTAATCWAHSGIRLSGTRRPENSSSTVKKMSKTGPTRVVQNVTSPSSQSSIERRT